ncbi:MAG: phosphodiesterase [Rhodospirillaceae bacterium]|nr:phosphodiesterase [Rhodospirillaceae bacterium]|tara:strand:- start:800 stop:1552 length:753 start_codon:yes stop_codon:yes gene_type:complete
MLIAQISDTHILSEQSQQNTGRLRSENLSRCISDINLQKPDIVIFTGDTVQHGKSEEYAHLKSLIAPLQAPVFIIPGNRDNKTALRTAFKDQPYMHMHNDFLHYAIDEYPLRLIALDSTEEDERKGVFCKARQQWLKKTLSDELDYPTILFIHHPPFDVEDHYTDGYRRADEALALSKIVSRYPQIERLVCGHVHCYFECNWSNTRASTMPSIAVDLRRYVDNIECQQKPAYVLHRRTSSSAFTSKIRVL